MGMVYGLEAPSDGPWTRVPRRDPFVWSGQTFAEGLHPSPRTAIGKSRVGFTGGQYVRVIWVMRCKGLSKKTKGNLSVSGTLFNTRLPSSVNVESYLLRRTHVRPDPRGGPL